MGDLSKCPGCGGPADNGHDRCDPPSPYYCTKCEAIDAEAEMGDLMAYQDSGEFKTSDEALKHIQGLVTENAKLRELLGRARKWNDMLQLHDPEKARALFWDKQEIDAVLAKVE